MTGEDRRLLGRIIAYASVTLAAMLLIFTAPQAERVTASLVILGYAVGVFLVTRYGE